MIIDDLELQRCSYYDQNQNLLSQLVQDLMHSQCIQMDLRSIQRYPYFRHLIHLRYFEHVVHEVLRKYQLDLSSYL